MSELSQAEADRLFSLEKQQSDEVTYTLPGVDGGRIEIPLVSLDGRESFLLDVQRARIDLKGTLQKRSRTVHVLARICIGRSPHTNPDGVTFPCPHLHLYREGFGDKWAMPLPDDIPWRRHDLALLFDDFVRYCHITGTLRVQGSLL